MYDFDQFELSQCNQERLKTVTCPIPDNENKRIGILLQTKLLDSNQSEKAFDRFTFLASRIFNMPVAYISFVDIDRVWYKSKIGVEWGEVSRSRSLDAYVVLPDSSEICVVSDVSADERFRDCGLEYQGKPLKFFAGASIFVDEVRIGSLSIMDTAPHHAFSLEDKENLLDLSAGIAQLAYEKRQNNLNLNVERANIVVSMMHNLRTPMTSLNFASSMLQLEAEKISAGSQVPVNSSSSSTHFPSGSSSNYQSNSNSPGRQQQAVAKEENSTTLDLFEPNANNNPSDAVVASSAEPVFSTFDVCLNEINVALRQLNILVDSSLNLGQAIVNCSSSNSYQLSALPTILSTDSFDNNFLAKGSNDESSSANETAGATATMVVNSTVNQITTMRAATAFSRRGSNTSNTDHSHLQAQQQQLVECDLLNHIEKIHQSLLLTQQASSSSSSNGNNNNNNLITGFTNNNSSSNNNSSISMMIDDWIVDSSKLSQGRHLCYPDAISLILISTIGQVSVEWKNVSIHFSFVQCMEESELDYPDMTDQLLEGMFVIKMKTIDNNGNNSKGNSSSSSGRTSSNSHLIGNNSSPCTSPCSTNTRGVRKSMRNLGSAKESLTNSSKIAPSSSSVAVTLMNESIITQNQGETNEASTGKVVSVASSSANNYNFPVSVIVPNSRSSNSNRDRSDSNCSVSHNSNSISSAFTVESITAAGAASSSSSSSSSAVSVKSVAVMNSNNNTVLAASQSRSSHSFLSINKVLRSLRGGCKEYVEEQQQPMILPAAAAVGEDDSAATEVGADTLNTAATTPAAASNNAAAPVAASNTSTANIVLVRTREFWIPCNIVLYQQGNKNSHDVDGASASITNRGEDGNNTKDSNIIYNIKNNKDDVVVAAVSQMARTSLVKESATMVENTSNENSSSSVVTGNIITNTNSPPLNSCSSNNNNMLLLSGISDSAEVQKKDTNLSLPSTKEATVTTVSSSSLTITTADANKTIQNITNIFVPTDSVTIQAHVVTHSEDNPTSSVATITSTPPRTTTTTVSHDTTTTTADVHILNEEQHQQLHVLVIEDTIPVQKLLGRWLQKAGCKVSCANNGKIGLQHLTTTKVDIAIVDFLMPVMLGLTTMKLFQEFIATNVPARDPIAVYNQNALILGMSATALESEQEEAFDYGMHFFCPKPTDMKILDIIVRAKREHSLNNDKAIDIICEATGTTGDSNSSNNNDSTKTSTARRSSDVRRSYNSSTFATLTNEPLDEQQYSVAATPFLSTSIAAFSSRRSFADSISNSSNSNHNNGSSLPSTSTLPSRRSFNDITTVGTTDKRLSLRQQPAGTISSSNGTSRTPSCKSDDNNNGSSSSNCSSSCVSTNNSSRIASDSRSAAKWSIFRSFKQSKRKITPMPLDLTVAASSTTTTTIGVNAIH